MKSQIECSRRGEGAASIFRLMRPSVTTRFLRKVKKDNSGCWLWTGCTNKIFRPFFSFQGKSEYAYRVAWLLFKGPIPEGLHLCHTCDVSNCVNPEHLFLGTHADNMAGAARKNLMKFGAGHHNHKLTGAQVNEIRRSPESCRSFGRRFGVSHQMISLVKRGKRRTKGV